MHPFIYAVNSLAKKIHIGEISLGVPIFFVNIWVSTNFLNFLGFLIFSSYQPVSLIKIGPGDIELKVMLDFVYFFFFDCDFIIANCGALAPLNQGQSTALT